MDARGQRSTSMGGAPHGCVCRTQGQRAARRNHRFSDAHLVDGKKLLRVHAVGKRLGYEFPGNLFSTSTLAALAGANAALPVPLHRTGQPRGQFGRLLHKVGELIEN